MLSVGEGTIRAKINAMSLTHAIRIPFLVGQSPSVQSSQEKTSETYHVKYQSAMIKRNLELCAMTEYIISLVLLC